MKVAFISTVQGHRWPGSEYLWSECAGQLLTSGHQCFARVSSDCAGAEVLRNLAARGLVVEYDTPRPGRWSRVRDQYISPFRGLTAFAPDVIVVSSGSAYDPFYQPALGRFLQGTDRPFIFICHFNAETFWVDEAMRGVMGRIYQKAAGSVFVSHENRRLTERQLAVEISKSKIIPPPLRLDLPAPLPWPEPTPEGLLRLACVARLEPRWKGQDVLFEVLAGPKWKDRNYALSLFGEGAEEAYLRRLAKFFGLGGKVIFAGYASPQKIWSTHHLQVLPARGEGGPMVTTEGMMCGRIAVSTRCGHNPDYIVDGDTGFLAAFPTAECFDAKLEEAWSVRLKWREMGFKAHAAIRQKMDSFAATGRLMSLIHEITA
jgi:glycosyltransferase involved in cell wall biosynthesis